MLARPFLFLPLPLVLLACAAEPPPALPQNLAVATPSSSVPRAPLPPTWAPPAACHPKEPVERTIDELVAMRPPPPSAALFPPALVLPLEDLGTTHVALSRVARSEMSIVIGRLPCAWAFALDVAGPKERGAIVAFLAARADVPKGIEAASPVEHEHAIAVTRAAVDDARAALEKHVDAMPEDASGVRLFTKALLAEDRARSAEDEGERDRAFAFAAAAFARVVSMKGVEPRLREYARAASLLLVSSGDRATIAAVPLTWADGDTLFWIADGLDEAGEFERADVAYELAAKLHPYLVPYATFRRMTMSRNSARWKEAALRAGEIGSHKGEPWDDLQEAAKEVLREAGEHLAMPVPAAGSSNVDRVAWLVHRCGPSSAATGRIEIPNFVVDVQKDGTAGASAWAFLQAGAHRGLDESIVLCLVTEAPKVFAGAKKSARFKLEWW